VIAEQTVAMSTSSLVQVERATALGWFLSGTLLGPALGPLLGGLIVTYKSWRVIFWLQSALAGAAVILVLFLLPETIHRKKSQDLKGLSRKDYYHKLWTLTNPVRVISLYRYPNLLVAVSFFLDQKTD
jgi:MFS family permease